MISATIDVPANVDQMWIIWTEDPYNGHFHHSDAIKELLTVAKRMGADGVLGIHVLPNVFSAGGGGGTFFHAYGTAVRWKKSPS